jgi:hypothetical protein
MKTASMINSVLFGKTGGKRTLGRSLRRCKGITMHLKEIGWRDGLDFCGS